MPLSSSENKDATEYEIHRVQPHKGIQQIPFFVKMRNLAALIFLIGLRLSEKAGECRGDLRDFGNAIHELSDVPFASSNNSLEC